MTLNGRLIRPPKLNGADRDLIRRYYPLQKKHWRAAPLASVRARIKSGLLALQSYRCAYCQVALVDQLGMVEIDHIIAAELCPQFLYHAKNLILTCKRCNARKGALNVTALKDAQLKSFAIYRFSSQSFNWVHPYYDVYEEHISIKDGMVFEATDGSSKGVALIYGCGLHEMEEVLNRHIDSILWRAAKLHEVVLGLIAFAPLVPALQLAKSIPKEKREGMSVREIEELIERLRFSSPSGLLRLLRADG